jgi:hypothetical protein
MEITPHPPLSEDTDADYKTTGTMDVELMGLGFLV